MKKQPKIEVKQLGPRQQFTGKNGLRYRLVSKQKAFEEMARHDAH